MGYINTQKFSNAGSYTYTPTPGTVSIKYLVRGATGAGGGVSVTPADKAAAGGGGAEGGRSEGWMTSGFAGLPIVVGAHGVGVADGSVVGQDGGASSFGTITAPGGHGGNGGAAYLPPNASMTGGNSAPATGGQNNYAGVAGGTGFIISLTQAVPGVGGNGPRGHVGSGSSGAGQNAYGPGQGGSGAFNAAGSATAYKGGNGFDGEVIIEEYDS